MEHWPQILLQYLPNTSDASQPYIKAALEAIIFHMSPRTSGLRFDGSPRPEPEIRLLGTNLCVNGIFIPLASRPLTFKLIASFFADVSLQVDRQCILQEVYGCQSRDKGAASERMTQSYDCNLNKLISRTRKLIVEALASAGWSHSLKWIVFDAESKLWRLWAYRDGRDDSPDSEQEEEAYSDSSYEEPILLML